MNLTNQIVDYQNAAQLLRGVKKKKQKKNEVMDAGLTYTALHSEPWILPSTYRLHVGLSGHLTVTGRCPTQYAFVLA